ncbi:hypothetical protein PFFVO_06072, partial [Plasmodium falciparum Vietnam Oak-Knoll (FVO)]
WIEKQKEQFDKQVKKYGTEISGGGGGGGRSGSGRKKRAATTTKYEGYESKFYKELQNNGYQTVDKFLEKLSNEKACTAVDDNDGGTIHFEKVNTGGTAGTSGGASGTNDKNEGTFYRSEYCQPCPVCGVKKVNNGGNQWEEKNKSEQCNNIKLYKPIKPEVGTPIRILKSGEGETEIKEKLEQFCNQINRGTTNNGGNGTGGVAGGSGGNSDSQDLYQKWTCYQIHQVEKDKNPEGEDDEDDGNYVEKGGGLCILEKNKNKKEKEKEKKSDPEPKEIQKTFYDFFYYWVAHMLKDSIHWKKKLEKCLKNKSKKCGNQQCKDDCGCFEKWVNRKQQEWEQIIIHFKKQEGFGVFGHDYVLEGVLQKKELLTSLQEGYGDANEIKHIKQLLEDEENVVDDSKKKNTIDKLIDHELTDATKCKQKQEECERQKQLEEERSRGRAAETREDERTQQPADSAGEVEEEEDDEDGDEEEHKEEEEDAEGEVVEETVAEVTEEQVEPTATDGDCEQADKKVEEKEESEQPEASGEPGSSGGEDTASPEAPSREKDQVPQDKVETESKTKPLAPTPPATPRPLPKPKPPKPDLPPALKNAMLSSTIMWSIGIGFATFTYFYLK